MPGGARLPEVFAGSAVLEHDGVVVAALVAFDADRRPYRAASVIWSLGGSAVDERSVPWATVVDRMVVVAAQLHGTGESVTNVGEAQRFRAALREARTRRRRPARPVGAERPSVDELRKIKATGQGASVLRARGVPKSTAYRWLSSV